MFWVVPGNSAAGPHMLPNVHKPGILCTRPTLHLFVPDIVGDHTHTHAPRTQSTRQHKPCPLEAAAARVEGARSCFVLAAAGPIACGGSIACGIPDITTGEQYATLFA